MTVLYPEATPAQGNTSVVVVQTIADKNAPKLATEINAASSVNISCYLYGQLEATSNQNKGTAPNRMCDTVTLEILGNTTYSLAGLEYLFDPQGDAADDPNKAKTTLAPGAEVWLVVRKGLSARNTAYAASQKVDLHHVRLGVQNDVTVGDGEFAEYAKRQEVVYIEPPIYGVTVAA